MKLYGITREESANPTTISLLKKACDKLGVTFVLVESAHYDFSNPLKIEPGSCLYNMSVDTRSTTAFKTLVKDNVATVFNNSFAAINFSDNVKAGSILHANDGLPIIKTVFDLTRNKKILKDYSDYLGGFPLIIKAEGGSHGVGVIKVDKFDSLISIADYLTSKVKGSYILRQFIDYAEHARLIVLDGKVVDSVEYQKVTHDFRSNAGKDIKVKPKKFSQEVENIAIKAVKSFQADFGGVDILIDKAGQPFLAEVNIPCFFPRTQLATGKDVATELVKSLVRKAEKL